MCLEFLINKTINASVYTHLASEEHSHCSRQLGVVVGKPTVCWLIGRT